MEETITERIKRAAQALRDTGARQVYVFGSAANGVLRPGSDVDMAIAGLPPKRFFEAMGKASDILQVPLDLIDLDEENAFTRYLREDEELVSV